jgi:hypothetical protein
MDARAIEGYGTYHAQTDATTAGEIAGSPEMAGQLASMLPTVLGAAGGLAGGAVSTIGKIPEALMQAGGQAVGAAMQSLSGLMTPKLDEPAVEGGNIGDDHGSAGVGGASGGGETTPAAGAASSSGPSVVPSTGPAPTPPSVPSGAVPAPVAPSTGPAGAGMMPMGMPLGGMSGGAGGHRGDDRVRPKKLVVPPAPHTESVTGKVVADRIAMSLGASGSKEPAPPNDDGDGPPRLSRPIVRRITTVGPKDDE